MKKHEEAKRNAKKHEKSRRSAKKHRAGRRITKSTKHNVKAGRKLKKTKANAGRSNN